MNDREAVRLPSHTWLALCAYLQETGSGADVEEVAALAIGEWLAQKRSRTAKTLLHADHGYQWKSLFLPSGTRLRMDYAGTTHYAEVDGDDIIFAGRKVSPAQMVNSIAEGTRNAWRDISLLMPGERHYKSADLRRSQARDLERRLASPPAAMPPPPPTAPVEDSVHLKRLANMIERALSERSLQYRRRTDGPEDIAFDA